MKQTGCINCKNISCLFNGSNSSGWLENSTCSAGQHIFIEDMPVKGLYVVQKGNVIEYYLDKKERKKTIHTAKSGEIFGHRDYSGTKHEFSAIAIKDAQICCFNKNILYEVCLKNTELSNNLLKFFSDELNKSDRRKINLDIL